MRGEVEVRFVLPPRKISAPGRSAKRPARELEATDLDPAGLTLFESLRAWRLETARQERVPPYVVASDRTLRDIARLRPRSLDELRIAHGIGPAKVRRFGEDFLRVVRESGATVEI